MAKKTKLELTWIGKDERPRLEPRVLVEDTAKSYHAPQRVSENDIFDNRLIFGDNLLALKALEQEFSGKIKCIYIDPPYNTGSAFEHYDDGIEHSIWLSMMRQRIEILRALLAVNGSLWVSIDDNEMPYLRLVLDEVFGRSNFVAQCIWQKTFSPNSTAKHLSDMHDYIVVYAKNKDSFKRNLLPRTAENDRSYRNQDDDPRGPWTSSDLSARNYYSLGTYSVTSPTGNIIDGPPTGRYWTINKDRFRELDNDNRIWWGVRGTNQPRLKRFLSEVMEGTVPTTLWLHQEVGHTQAAKQEVMAVLPGGTEVFQTPKPEKLLHRILHIASDKGDWVLDSFGGSGTTGAVAHKMGRKWIMVELGEHCHTHIIPRLKKVIEGEDPGGVTEATGWNGGGGFRYYSLAPSLLQKDNFGNWVINREYNAELLAQAVCKIEGFTYSPSDQHYWQQGHSTERDYIYVTTQTLTRQQIDALAEEIGPNRSLVVYCRAFKVKNVEVSNLTLKKIPKAVLTKCEWGHDDYSLEIRNLPAADPRPDAEGSGSPSPKSRRARKKAADHPTLFAMEGTEQ
ncbi:MAG: site-specific DNA-methyltransferase [Planctomycetota bacterium]|nr:site-specific DNA-methyltransferase [Planctomycetota bacterium]